MIPGREVTGKHYLTEDCPAGGKHEWELEGAEEENDEEARALFECKKCGEGLWRIVAKLSLAPL